MPRSPKHKTVSFAEFIKDEKLFAGLRAVLVLDGKRYSASVTSVIDQGIYGFTITLQGYDRSIPAEEKPRRINWFSKDDIIVKSSSGAYTITGNGREITIFTTE